MSSNGSYQADTLREKEITRKSTMHTNGLEQMDMPNLYRTRFAAIARLFGLIASVPPIAGPG
jgi:hypothetical protein